MITPECRENLYCRCKREGRQREESRLNMACMGVGPGVGM